MKKKQHKKQRSKRYLEASKNIETNKAYPIEEAIELAKKTSGVKFDATIEAHFKLGINPVKGDQMVRFTIIMPHSIGRTKTIAAIVPEDKEKEAKEAGADIAGGENLIEDLKKSEKINFDILIATPEMMKQIAPLAKLLGPKGLMPSPKNDTVTTDIKKTVKELKAGKIAFRNDDTANVHTIVGKTSLDSVKLIENFNVFKEALLKAKPTASKGSYIKNISISSSMGPGIKVSVN